MVSKKHIKKEISITDAIITKIRKNPDYTILVLLVIFYTFALSWIEIHKFQRFEFPDFDLAIADQAAWLLSQGKEPFVTVRGLHIFGDHIQFNYLLIAPFYWILDDIRVLFFLQSFWLGLGAIPIYLIAREKFSGNIPFVFVISYLLYPALHFLNLENFHPVSMGVPLFLFAFYFLIKRNYLPYFLLISLLLLTREEYPFTIFMMGVFAALKINKKVGIATSIISIVWLLVAFNFILPSFKSATYSSSFSRAGLQEFGDNMQEVIINMALNPGRVMERAAKPVNQQYFFDVFTPVAFIPLLSYTVILSFPALFINFVSGWHYAHFINYHYTSAIIPFVFIASIYGIAALRDFTYKRNIHYKEILFKVMITAFLISAIFGNMIIGPKETSLFSGYFLNSLTSRDYSPYEVRYEAINLIPEDASVSASYLFLPHLSHREVLYMLPNPFKEAYWGFELGNFTPPTPTRDTDYILLDGTADEFQRNVMIKQLLENGMYYKIFEKQDIMILKRNESVEYNFVLPG